MAYTTPYIFTALELLTAAKLNAMQGNITFLYDLSILPRPHGVLLNTDVALTTGDDKYRFTIPSMLNGWNITGVVATRSAGTGVPAFQLRNVTDSVDVLSTKVTIDSGETSSATAATPAVIDTTKDDVATGDIFAWDCDVSGTGTFYTYLIVEFTKP